MPTKRIEAESMAAVAEATAGRRFVRDGRDFMKSLDGEAAVRLSQQPAYLLADNTGWKEATWEQVVNHYVRKGVVAWRKTGYGWQEPYPCLDCACGWPCIHKATAAARATRRGE